jgi:hypothetical protein
MWTRKASSRLEGTRPEEIPAGEGPADLLERFPSRGPVAGVSGGCGTYWRLSRRWRRRRERRFSLPGGGQVTTDGSNRRHKSTEPPSPLALIPRLDGAPVPRTTGLTTSATRAYLDPPPSFCLLLSHTRLLSHICSRILADGRRSRGRGARPRERRMSAGGATLASERPGRSNRRRRRPAGRGRPGPAPRHRASGAGLDVRGGWLFPGWMTVSGLG